MNAQFGGTILATTARRNTADIEAPVIVNTLNSTGSQIHLYSVHPAMWAVAPARCLSHRSLAW